MTDVNPVAAELRAIRSRIAEARQRVKALEDERDAAIVAAIGDEPPYGLIALVAHASGVSRQRIDTIRRIARAQRNS